MSFVSAKTDTIRYMAGSTPLDKMFQSLIGRVFIAVLQTVLSSVVFLLTIFFWQPFEVPLLKYILVIGIGLIAGFSARRFLRSNTLILIHLVALGSIALSLAILFLISGGFLGVNLYYQVGGPDWGSLIQFLTASINAALVINAFRTPPVVKDIPVSAPARRVASPSPQPGPAISLPSTTLRASRTRFQLQLPKLIRPAGKKAQKNTVKTTPPAKLSLAPVLKPEVKKPTRVKKKKTRKRSIKTEEIKFVGEMEHTCPYCLDPVEPNDPRGVKICPICKTHHHADCWGITGACQIPHSQE